MIYQINHISRIRYSGKIRIARFNLRLKPALWPGQQIHDFSLVVSPRPSNLSTRPGAFLVNVTRVVIDEPIAALEITSRFLVRVADLAPQILVDDPSIASVARMALVRPDMGATGPANYLFTSPLAPLVPEITAWAADYLPPDTAVLEAGLALCRAITAGFRYDGDATEADTPVQEAFAIRRGVCQDFAHILIVGLRSAGLPAAYASGYLRTFPPPGKPRLEGVDAMHAWVVLWCGPERGWIGLDPTNGCITGADHIMVAMGRDYSDVAPIDGIFVGKAAQQLDVSVDVVPVPDEATNDGKAALNA
ncbi:transglutaminase family protein [soil metagenome]